jgi:hypothetical protein
MTHEQGLALIKEYEGKRPPSLDLFLEFIGLTEEEFLDVAMSHGVSPYKHDPHSVAPGNKTPDFDRWPRHAPMPRDEAEVQLNRWRRRRT